MGAAGSIGADEKPLKGGVRDKKEDVEIALPTKFVESNNFADIFAKEMYCSTPKVDALQHVLSEEAGREAFMKFLSTEYASENLEFFLVNQLSQIDHMNLMADF